MNIRPAFRITGKVEGLYATPDTASFETAPVDALTLGFEGIPGDRHGGLTRRSGGREPWYPRGTEMRNERQVSILAPEELAGVARVMELPELRPEWIGGNLLVSGIAELTMLPPRTLLAFDGGVTIRVDGLNVPCRFSGRSIAKHFPERKDLDLAFVKAACRSRGLVAWVEKPGVVRMGEAVEARVPEQWIYEA